MMGGRRGISSLLVGNNHMPVMVARAGQASVHAGSSVQGVVMEVVVFCALCCFTLKLPSRRMASTE